MKKFESNGIIKENPFEIELLKENGEMADYYILNGEARSKITLSDLVNEQVSGINIDEKSFISSGDYAQNASSVDYAQNASSGDYTQNASSGDYAQNASSGDRAKNASSGYCAQNASSGYYAQNASSGDYAKNASSGYYAQNASSGDCAQNASSGDYTQNASSGDYTQNASSGYCAQNASSGDCAKNASSGDCARNDTSGKNSITFDCGFQSISKSVNGTWISLAEYKEIDNKWIPYFALSGQIGNEDYKDSLGKTLSENEWYMLINKQFTPIILDDGLKLIKLQSKMFGKIEVIKCKEIDEDTELYCVREEDLSAHGETLKEAMADLQFKKMKCMEQSEIVEKIKESGFVTREQYRAITGACQYGTEKFAKENGYADVEKVELKELLSKLSDNDFGAIEFKQLFVLK